MRVLRRRHRVKTANGPAALRALTLRADAPARSGTRALYPVVMAGDRQVDRDAWARVVGELIASETRGKIATFAKHVKVDERTVRHWLAGTVGVREESVRKVAEGTGRDVMDLLVEVGYYSRTEVWPVAENYDEEIELVRTDSGLTPEIKKRIIDNIVDRRNRERAAALEETRRMIELFRDPA
jgi:hypothetical protein